MKIIIYFLVIIAFCSHGKCDKCSSVKTADKKDCTAGEAGWTVDHCLAKGCCFNSSGAPFCYYGSGEPDPITTGPNPITNPPNPVTNPPVFTNSSVITAAPVGKCDAM